MKDGTCNKGGVYGLIPFVEWAVNSALGLGEDCAQESVDLGLSTVGSTNEVTSQSDVELEPCQPLMVDQPIIADNNSVIDALIVDQSIIANNSTVIQALNDVVAENTCSANEYFDHTTWTVNEDAMCLVNETLNEVSESAEPAVAFGLGTIMAAGAVVAGLIGLSYWFFREPNVDQEDELEDEADIGYESESEEEDIKETPDADADEEKELLQALDREKRQQELVEIEAAKVAAVKVKGKEKEKEEKERKEPIVFIPKNISRKFKDEEDTFFEPPRPDGFGQRVPVMTVLHLYRQHGLEQQALNGSSTNPNHWNLTNLDARKPKILEELGLDQNGFLPKKPAQRRETTKALNTIGYRI